MSIPALAQILIPLGTAFALIGAVLRDHLAIRYAPIIGRVFEEMPMFLPLRLAAEAGGEDVRFRTSDGLELRPGRTFRALTRSRASGSSFSATNT